jgi:hypothetical protein
MKMNWMRFLGSGVLVAAMSVLPASAVTTKMTKGSCTPGEPTAESYTWNFHQEASNLLNGIAADAHQVQSQADQLRALDRTPDISWQSDASQLTQIKAKVNDMGQKLCRLQVIRPAVLPWQQKATNQVASLVLLMKDNTQDAINYLNNNRLDLWNPTYRQYAVNLSNEASHASHTVNNYVEYAKVHQREQQLEQALGTKKVKS